MPDQPDFREAAAVPGSRVSDAAPDGAEFCIAGIERKNPATHMVSGSFERPASFRGQSCSLNCRALLRDGTLRVVPDWTWTAWSLVIRRASRRSNTEGARRALRARAGSKDRRCKIRCSQAPAKPCQAPPSGNEKRKSSASAACGNTGQKPVTPTGSRTANSRFRGKTLRFPIAAGRLAGRQVSGRRRMPHLADIIEDWPRPRPAPPVPASPGWPTSSATGQADDGSNADRNLTRLPRRLRGPAGTAPESPEALARARSGRGESTTKPASLPRLRPSPHRPADGNGTSDDAGIDQMDARSLCTGRNLPRCVRHRFYAKGIPIAPGHSIRRPTAGDIGCQNASCLLPAG